MESIAQLLDSQHHIKTIPTYLAMRCSDRKTYGNECSICSEVCPQGIYPEGKRKRPDYTQCIKCGICAANCPDSCITFPAQRVDNFLIAVSKSGEMGISCAEDDTVLTLNVSCLAAVSWEQMAYAAITKGLVISLNACESCKREGFKALIAENLEKLRFFLGDEVFEKKVKILRGGEEYPPTDTGMSRRELFNIFRNLPLDKAMRIMPEPMQSQDAGLFYRAMLRDAVKAEAEKLEPDQRPKYRVKMPVFTDNCFNCATCVFSCPQKALKILREGDNLIPVVEPWRCTGCGICMNSCKEQGISSISPMRISTLNRVALRKIPVHACVQCGKPRRRDAEDGLCTTCFNRRKGEQMREERRRKMEAEKARKEAEKAEKEAAEKAAAEEAAKETAGAEAPQA